MGRSKHSGDERQPENPSAEQLAKGLQKNPTHHMPGKGGSGVWEAGIKKIKESLGLDGK